MLNLENITIRDFMLNDADAMIRAWNIVNTRGSGFDPCIDEFNEYGCAYHSEYGDLQVKHFVGNADRQLLVYCNEKSEVTIIRGMDDDVWAVRVPLYVELTRDALNSLYDDEWFDATPNNDELWEDEFDVLNNRLRDHWQIVEWNVFTNWIISRQ